MFEFTFQSYTSVFTFIVRVLVRHPRADPELGTGREKPTLSQRTAAVGVHIDCCRVFAVPFAGSLDDLECEQVHIHVHVVVAGLDERVNDVVELDERGNVRRDAP